MAAIFILPYTIGQILLGSVWIWLAVKAARSKKTDATISLIYIAVTLAVGVFLALKLETEYAQCNKFVDFYLIDLSSIIFCVVIINVLKASAATVRLIAVMSCWIVFLSTAVATVNIHDNSYTLAEGIAYIFQYTAFSAYVRITYLPNDNTPPKDRKKKKAKNKK